MPCGHDVLDRRVHAEGPEPVSQPRAVVQNVLPVLRQGADARDAQLLEEVGFGLRPRGAGQLQGLFQAHAPTLTLSREIGADHPSTGKKHAASWPFSLTVSSGGSDSAHRGWAL